MSKKNITRICIYLYNNKREKWHEKERGKNNMIKEKMKNKEQRIKEWNKIFKKAKKLRATSKKENKM